MLYSSGKTINVHAANSGFTVHGQKHAVRVFFRGHHGLPAETEILEKFFTHSDLRKHGKSPAQSPVDQQLLGIRYLHRPKQPNEPRDRRSKSPSGSAHCLGYAGLGIGTNDVSDVWGTDCKVTHTSCGVGNCCGHLMYHRPRTSPVPPQTAGTHGKQPQMSSVFEQVE